MSTKGHFNISHQNALRLSFIALGIVLETLKFAHLLNEDVILALLLAFILACSEDVFERKLRSSHATDDIARKVEKFLSKKHGILNDLLDGVHNELVSVVKISEKGFSFAHQAIALHSYAEFWRLIKGAQEERTKSNPLHVHALHSCDLDVWQENFLSSRLYEIQREFSFNGGSTTRILCGRADEPDEETLKAAHKMISVGVEVRYYSIRSSHVDHNFAWDFMYVQETGKTVIWSSFSRRNGGAIDEATYHDEPKYKNADLRALWKDIHKYSVSMDASAVEAKLAWFSGIRLAQLSSTTSTGSGLIT